MCLALKVKKFEFWKVRKGGKPLSLQPHFLVGLVYFKYLLIPKFDPSSSNGFKFKILEDPIEGIPPTWHR